MSGGLRVAGGGSDGSNPRTVGPYVIESLIGRGGMGAVYRARHAPTGAPRAVKLVLSARLGPADGERALARFRREVRVLARLGSHPGIVGVHECGLADGVPWCAMELVDGDPLADRLRHGGLDLREAARVVRSVAEAVHVAHVEGVLHRDIKPENVLLERPDDRPRVVDFGLAYDAFAERLTRTGDLLGSPAYMAPEQVSSGERSLGPATDVYGLGGLLYAALTGEPPFPHESPLAVLCAVLETRAPSPSALRSDVPPALDAICLQALAKEPRDRYPSAEAFAADLGRWLDGKEVEARAPRSRRATVAGIGALALAVVGVVLAVAWAARSRETNLGPSARRAERLEIALDRVEAGHGDAIDEALRLLPDDDPALAPRRRFLTALARCRDGEPGLVASLPLESPPWDARRGTLVAVLVRAGRGDALAGMVGRDAALLEEERVGSLVVDTLIEEPALVSAAIARALFEVLDASGFAAIEGEATWLTNARTELGGPIVARLVDDDRPVQEARSDLERLLRHGRRGGVDPAFAERVAVVLGEPALRDAEGSLPEAARTDAALLRLETAVTLAPRGGAARTALAIVLADEAFAANHANARRRQSMRLGWRLGFTPSTTVLRATAPEIEVVVRQAGARLEGGALGSFEAGLLATDVFTLLLCASGVPGDSEALVAVQRLAGLKRHWRLVAWAIDRAKIEDDLPPYVVFRLAGWLTWLFSLDSDAHRSVDAWLAEAFGEEHVEAGPMRLDAAITELLEHAWRRRGSLEHDAVASLALARLAWDAQSTRRPSLPAPEDRVVRAESTLDLLAGLRPSPVASPPDRTAPNDWPGEDIDAAVDAALARAATVVTHLAASLHADALPGADPLAPCGSEPLIERLAAALRDAFPDDVMDRLIDGGHHIQHGRFAAAVERIDAPGLERGAARTQFQSLLLLARSELLRRDPAAARAALERSEALPTDRILRAHFQERSALWRMVGEMDKARRDIDRAVAAPEGDR